MKFLVFDIVVTLPGSIFRGRPMREVYNNVTAMVLLTYAHACFR